MSEVGVAAKAPQKENKMGTMPVGKLLLTMSVPMIISMIVQAMYNVVDSIFVAQYDPTALTAVSLVFPVQMFTMALGVGTGVGLNSLVSRRLGEQRYDAANSAATHGIILAFFSWVLVCIIAAFGTRPFYRFFSESDTLFNMACTYSNIVVYFSLGILLHLAIEKTLQATGNMIAPMIFQLVGAITNIILDPILIFGMFGAPRLGVAGAAIATVTGQFLSMFCALFPILFRKQLVKISFRGFRLDFTTIRDIYVVALPAIVMQSIGSVLITFLNKILTNFGEVAVSVLGVYYKLQSFVFMPVFGLTHGTMPIIGFSYGAKSRARLIHALKLGIIIAFCIMLAGTVLFWVAPGLLLSMFDSSGELTSVGIPALRTISLCFTSAAIGIMLSTLFQAVGRGLHSLIVSLMRQLVVLLPAAWLLAKLGLSFVWWAFPIAEGVSLVVSIALFAHLYHTDIKHLS